MSGHFTLALVLSVPVVILGLELRRLRAKAKRSTKVDPARKDFLP